MSSVLRQRYAIIDTIHVKYLVVFDAFISRSYSGAPRGGVFLGAILISQKF